MDEQRFALIEYRAGGEIVLALTGELDIDTASVLLEHIQLMDLEGDIKVVTVDLDQLGFMDSSGISGLIELHRRVEVRGIELRLVNVSDTYRRIIEIDGLTQYFGLEPDPDAE